MDGRVLSCLRVGTGRDSRTVVSVHRNMYCVGNARCDCLLFTVIAEMCIAGRAVFECAGHDGRPKVGKIGNTSDDIA